jgi:hypothetical protein
MKITQLLPLAFLVLFSKLAFAFSYIKVVDENDDPIPNKQITVADSVPFGTTSVPISYTTDVDGFVQYTPGPAVCYLIIRVQDCAGIWQTFVTDSWYPRGSVSHSSTSQVRVCKQTKPTTIGLNFFWRKSVFDWWPSIAVSTNFSLKHYTLIGSTPQLVGNYSFSNTSSLDTSFPHQDYGRFVLKAMDCTGDTITTIWDYDYNQNRVYESKIWICDTAPTSDLLLLSGGVAVGAQNYLPIVLKDSSFTNSTIQYDTLRTEFYSSGGYNFVNVDDTIPHPGNAQLTFFAQTCGGFLPIHEEIINKSIPRLTDTSMSFCPAYSFAIKQFALKPNAIVLPNPFNESIQINLAEEQRNARIDLIGMHGNVLLSQETSSELELKFDTEALPAGMYLLQIMSASGTETHKVIKR